MYENTSKPKHTIANKGNMKALHRFTLTEIEKHDHGEDFYANNMDVCKELICNGFYMDGVKAWIVQSKHVVECND